MKKKTNKCTHPYNSFYWNGVCSGQMLDFGLNSVDTTMLGRKIEDDIYDFIIQLTSLMSFFKM